MIRMLVMHSISRMQVDQNTALWFTENWHIRLTQNETALWVRVPPSPPFMNIPTIHISNWHDVKNYGTAGITHIISIGSDQVPPPTIHAFKGDFELHRFDFDDVADHRQVHLKPPSVQIMGRMINLFTRIRMVKEKSSVLFHCTAGMSRSPAAAFLYLVQCGLTYEEAYKKVTDVRGYVQPNPLMVKIVDQLMGHDGKMLHYVCHASGHPEYLTQKMTD